MVKLIKPGIFLFEQDIEIISPNQMNSYLEEYHHLKSSNHRRRSVYEASIRKFKRGDESLTRTELQELELWTRYCNEFVAFPGKLEDLNDLNEEQFITIFNGTGPRSSPLQFNIMFTMEGLPKMQKTLYYARKSLEKSLEHKILGLTSIDVKGYKTGMSYTGNAFIRGD